MNSYTSTTGDLDKIARSARTLLQGGLVTDDILRQSANLLQPLPVLGDDGGLHSWFVPLTINERLVAFFQFLADGTFMRYSSFTRRQGEFADCPLAENWLDTVKIQTRAATHSRELETTGEPYLTYDRSPDRLVWAVPLIHPSGGVRHVYVAGEVVYIPPTGEVFG